MPDRPLQILVVEDEPVNRALLRAVLGTAARLGPIELTEAATVAEGRARIGEARPDVVILDVRLPDGNGLDLARELDASGATPRPKIVVMSASVLPRDREVALAAGSDAFLGKPFMPRDLIGLLEELTRADGTRPAQA
jgi:CheY-like chemotaxis protein